MSLSQGLHLKQSQSLFMTQQLQQSIQLLQLNVQELSSFVESEIEKNPFLSSGEEDIKNNELQGESNSKDEYLERSIEQHKEDVQPLIDKQSGDAWVDETVSPAIYEEDSSYYHNVGKGGATSNLGDMQSILENTSENEQSLRHVIIDQINIDIKDNAKKIIATHLTDCLDESGYLTVELKDIAETLQCPIDVVEDVLFTLQNFEPTGVFSRNLEECLSLQLQEIDRLDPAMKKLLANLNLLAISDYKKLKKICQVDDEDLRDMCAELRRLNPKPGINYKSDVAQVLQPDVFLKSDGNGGWVVELNQDALPKLLVNKRYYTKVCHSVRDKETKKVLSEQLGNASWLIKALDQRAQTILKISTEILIQQQEFFKRGIQYLKPMRLNDIAENVDLHESTVSRVINGKYLATHVGLFELKYFFSSSISSDNEQEGVSSKSVKHEIKKIIDQETTDHIFSDDKIVLCLKEKGMNIARRTVAKYREAMNIPSSSVRRRMKKLQ